MISSDLNEDKNPVFLHLSSAVKGDTISADTNVQIFDKDGNKSRLSQLQPQSLVLMNSASYIARLD